MKRTAVIGGIAAVGIVAAVGVAARLHAQGRQGGAPAAPASPIPTFQVPADPLYKLEDGMLRWPLAAENKQYAAIDGKKLHQYVEDQTAISRRYRDAGHPQ